MEKGKKGKKKTKTQKKQSGVGVLGGGTSIVFPHDLPQTPISSFGTSWVPAVANGN